MLGDDYQKPRHTMANNSSGHECEKKRPLRTPKVRPFLFEAPPPRWKFLEVPWTFQHIRIELSMVSRISAVGCLAPTQKKPCGSWDCPCGAAGSGVSRLKLGGGACMMLSYWRDFMYDEQGDISTGKWGRIADSVDGGLGGLGWEEGVSFNCLLSKGMDEEDIKPKRRI